MKCKKYTKKADSIEETDIRNISFFILLIPLLGAIVGHVVGETRGEGG